MCQRRTADLGDIDLEDVTPADLPGNREQIRSAATALAHPPGQPVCRTLVHFVIQQHFVGTNPAAFVTDQ